MNGLEQRLYHVLTADAERSRLNRRLSEALGCAVVEDPRAKAAELAETARRYLEQEEAEDGEG